LLLSRNEAYAVRELVIVSPLTTRIRNLPSEVTLGTGDGVPGVSVINLDVINTIPKSSLQEQIATLSISKMREVTQAINFALSL
jgi:mRNA interferase MazF